MRTDVDVELTGVPGVRTASYCLDSTDATLNTVTQQKVLNVGTSILSYKHSLTRVSLSNASTHLTYYGKP